MTDEQKVQAAIEAGTKAKEDFNNTQLTAMERARAYLTIAQQEQKQAEATARIKEKADKEREKTLDKIADKQKEILSLEEKQAQASKDVAKAKADVATAKGNYATANRDRVAGSLGELASGQRGTLTEQREARKEAKLRQRAQKEFDYGTPEGEKKSAATLEEADAIRKKLGGRIQSGESDPMKAQAEAIKTAQESMKTTVEAQKEIAADIKTMRESVDDLKNSLK